MGTGLNNEEHLCATVRPRWWVYRLVGPLHQLERAAAEPAISYAPDVQRSDVDGFLRSNRTMGLLILHGDRILVERYQYDRTPEQRFHSQSIAKTVVAMLVGIALQEGKIRAIDDLAQDYVPALADSPYGKTSLRHLLTMSSVVKYVETYEPGDDNAILTACTYKQQSAGGVDTLAPFAAREREVPAGTRFYYASSETVALALVLRIAVGVPLADYLSEKVWKPMGAEAHATWLIDAAGYEVGFVGLNATLRDYGRLGLLLANEGVVAGRQVVPVAWVRAMTTPDAPHLRYGAASHVFRAARHPRAGHLRRSNDESGDGVHRGARGFGHGCAPGAIRPVLRDSSLAQVAEQIGVAFSQL